MIHGAEQLDLLACRERWQCKHIKAESNIYMAIVTQTKHNILVYTMYEELGITPETCTRAESDEGG